jgi:hypothetical protein
MDSVRFGRVLGKGARAAARGLYEAVDAAVAPNPNAPQTSPQAAPQQRPQQPRPQPQTPLQAIVEANAVYTTQKRVVTREAGKLGKSMFAPFARAGKVLWLEVTGTFFSLFAVVFLGNVWKYRAAWRLSGTNVDLHRRLLGAVIATAIFGYFAVSSFVRARQRERRA